MKLELYHKTNCPYSAKVRAYLHDSGLQEMVTYHDIEQEDGAAEELELLTGDDQVPCLVSDGRAICESQKIIDFLEGAEEPGAASKGAA